jgi:prepilin peptidase CpaA
VEKFLLIGALIVATVGAIQDVRARRIPNWLTYSGLAMALAVRPVLAGWPGLKDGLLGMLAGGGIFYLVFLAGGMGGGDVKLMAAVGAWAGTPQTMYVLVTTAIAGGILAVGYMIFRRQVRTALSNTAELIRHHLSSGIRPHPVLNVRAPDSLRIPYGLAIAIGTVYCVGTMFWRG